MLVQPGQRLQQRFDERIAQAYRRPVLEFAQVEDISASTIPPDFARNARIHRAWRIVARGG